jgi:hypothetical protein
MLKDLKARIRRNPKRNQTKLALQMKVSPNTMQRAIRIDLGMKAYKRGSCHMLTTPQKIARVQKCKRLLKRYGEKKVKFILFTDEKIFTVEEKFNKQNDRIYAKSSKEVPLKIKKVKKSHHPGSIMVWAGVSCVGKAPLVFVEKGVKVRARNYQTDILEKVVEPLNIDLFNGKPWTFQQDSAPAHKAKTTQNWLKTHIPDFISIDGWPSASPDLNPLDYSIWAKLESSVCSKPHTSMKALKKSLTREWDRLSMEQVRNSIEEWRPRLQSCIDANGGNFEI